MCLHCKGCQEVARLFGEVEDLRQILESLHEEDGHRTGFGGKRRSKRGSNGKSGRSGGEGEVRRSGDTRQTTFRQRKAGMERGQRNEIHQKIGPPL